MKPDKELYILPVDGKAGARKVVSRLRDIYGVDLCYPSNENSVAPTPSKRIVSAIPICKNLLPNVPVKVCNNTSGGTNYRYNQKTGKYSLWFDKKISKSNVIHDIAHWMVAGTITRRRDEFGLGDSPDDSEFFRRSNTDRLLTPSPYNLVVEVEKYASALGIAIEFSLGLDYADTLKWHNWDFKEITREWKVLQKYCGGRFI